MYMAKRTMRQLLLGGLACLTLTSANSLACTCGGSGGKTMWDVVASYCDGPEASKIVFEGTVQRQVLKVGPIGVPATAMSMTMHGEHRVVTFRILRTYRGHVTGSVVVLTGMGGGDCGFDFETGKQYLVYADRIDAANLFTSICTGTSLLAHGGPALRYLRGQKLQPDDLLDVPAYRNKYEPQWTGTVCGNLTRPDGIPLDHASIELTHVRNDSVSPRVVPSPKLTGPDGSFCVGYIPPGKYILTAEKMDFDANRRWMGYYPGVGTHLKAIPIEIHEDEDVDDLHFTVMLEPLSLFHFELSPPLGVRRPWIGSEFPSTARNAMHWLTI